MKAYLVGGYVRDRLLGLEPVDRDWVVVGETPDSMQRQGYKLAGKGFPVFLHPVTGEVYALARTDREGGSLHGDRRVFAASDVTLEEDLARRDLTVNAMAMKPDGELIDPFGGERDLRAGVLRHVGPGFCEDPVRVLRLARFAARFDFTVTDETRSIVSRLVRSGDLDSLVGERVWAELIKALSEDHPEVFFLRLHEWGALRAVFPEVDRLLDTEDRQTDNLRPEPASRLVDSLRKAASLSDDKVVRFGALVHRFGIEHAWQSDAGMHARNSQHRTKTIADFCGRWGCPARYQRFGIACAKFGSLVHGAFSLDAAGVIRLFEGIGAFKRPDDMERLILVCQSDTEEAENPADTSFAQADFLKILLDAASGVCTDSIRKQGVTGAAFGRRLRELRIAAVEDAMHVYKNAQRQ